MPASHRKQVEGHDGEQSEEHGQREELQQHAERAMRCEQPPAAAEEGGLLQQRQKPPYVPPEEQGDRAHLGRQEIELILARAIAAKRIERILARAFLAKKRRREEAWAERERVRAILRQARLIV